MTNRKILEQLRKEAIARRSFLQGIGLAGLSVVGSGLPWPGSGVARAQDTALRVSVDQAFSSLDATRRLNALSPFAACLVVERLVDFDLDGKLIPRLAESWSQPDPTTLVYQIRPGVTWSDGSPLTAEDVVWSFTERTLNPDMNGQAGNFEGWDAVEQTGDAEVTIRLKSPIGYWRNLPATWVASIYQRAQIEAHGDAVGSPKHMPIGTGPYVFTEFVPESRVELTRRDDYWGETPDIETLTLSSVPDEGTRLLAMQSGETDIVLRAPVALLDRYDEIDGVTADTVPNLRVMTLHLNVRSAPFDDLNVRKALAHAIDRSVMAAALMGGRGIVAEGIVSKFHWGDLMTREDLDSAYARLPSFGYSIDAAKQALAASAYPDGFETELLVHGEIFNRTSQVISAAVAEIGVTLNVREVPRSVIDEALESAEKLPIQLISFGPNYPDPTNNLYILFHSKFAGEFGFNVSNYENPEVDALLDSQISDTDVASRNDKILEAMALIQADAVSIPLFEQVEGIAYRDNLTVGSFGTWMRNTEWASRISRG